MASYLPQWKFTAKAVVYSLTVMGMYPFLRSIPRNPVLANAVMLELRTDKTCLPGVHSPLVGHLTCSPHVYSSFAPDVDASCTSCTDLDTHVKELE